MSQYRDFKPKDDPQGQEGDADFYGVNARLAPENIPQGYLADGWNVRMRDADVVTRKGVMKPGWLNRPAGTTGIAPGTILNGAGTFKDPDGQEFVLVAADGDVLRCKAHNGRIKVQLPTGVQVRSRCTFIQAFNKVFCFRGRHLAPLILRNTDDGFEDLLPHWDATTSWQAEVLSTGTLADEVSYGPWLATTSLSSLDDLATVVTTDEHGYVTGADVVISGASESGYNGRWNITVIDEKTFTYQFGGATSPATGTPVVSNQSHYWKALGSKVTVTSWTNSASTIVATKNGHGFAVGEWITIAGAVPVAYNGTRQITGKDANTFTMAVATDPGANTTPGTAQSSKVQAAQSPASNPEAWARVWNVLPNADDALFVNNRLLVPTAYTPGTDTYDSTSHYAKKDFIVAMDIGDDVHFDFSAEFRINEGSDDEIVTLLKYNATTVIVFKGKSWGIINNVVGTLADISLDMHGDAYGACAPGSAVVAGTDVLFASTRRGICSLRQNALGQTRSVDVPFSNDLARIVARINWNLADKIRLAWWDDRLFCAVPLDDGVLHQETVVPVDDNGAATAVYGTQWGQEGWVTYPGLVVGERYMWQAGANEYSIQAGTGVLNATGVMVASTTTAVAMGKGGQPITGRLYRLIEATNNALLVYDFRAGQGDQSANTQSGSWAGVDTGSALCVKEFFKANYNGEERLFFLAADGWINLLEETVVDDQVAGMVGGLGWEEIESGFETRGYVLGNGGPKRWKRAEPVVSVWDAKLTLTQLPGAAYADQVLREDLEFSRTKYLKPAGKAPYVEGNVNGDFETPGRGNYSVALVGGGVALGAGISVGKEQEVIARSSMRPTQARYVQFRLRNTQGRFRLMSWNAAASEGDRRNGIVV